MLYNNEETWLTVTEIVLFGGWRDVSTVRSTCCSSKGLFGSQYLHQKAHHWLLVTPGLRDLAPSSGFCRHYTHSIHSFRHTHKHINKNKINLKKKLISHFSYLGKKMKTKHYSSPSPPPPTLRQGFQTELAWNSQSCFSFQCAGITGVYHQA